MRKLIDVDKLLESLELNIKVYQKLADKQTPVNAKFVVADLKGFLRKINEAPDLHVKEDVDLEKVYDAYCKVCGHYHHTTPAHICRQVCDYFKDFKALLNARKEE